MRDTEDAALRRIEQLELENRELSSAIYHYRMVLEHYLTIAASVGADPAPAAEALKRLPRGPSILRLVKLKR